MAYVDGLKAGREEKTCSAMSEVNQVYIESESVSPCLGMIWYGMVWLGRVDGRSFDQKVLSLLL